MKNLLLALSFVLTIACTTVFAQNNQNAPKQQEQPLMTVEIQNNAFSTSAKTKEGVIIIPQILSSETVKSWTFVIKDSKDEIIKSLNGTKSLPQRFVWKGFDDNNISVAEGQYFVRLSVEIERGFLVFESSNVFIDVTPPLISLRTADDIYFIEESGKLNKKINIHLNYSDDHGINPQASGVVIVNAYKVPVKRIYFSSSSIIPDFISWDGKDDIYGTVVPPGNYRIAFLVSDKSGNKEQVKSVITVLGTPRETDDKEKEFAIARDNRGLLMKISAGDLFNIQDAGFVFGAEKILNEAVETIKMFPEKTSVVNVYSSSAAVSAARAEAVVNFLVDRGAQREKIIYNGYENFMVPSGDAAKDGNAVEIIVLKGKESSSAAEDAFFKVDTPVYDEIF
ncbi:hypothetical protein [Endomicrobium proavitum]|nr:hypothetical protein [Endomicrobium proavitum]